MKIKLITLLLLASFSIAAQSQNIALKSNLLYGVTTLTPNIGTELGLNNKTTLELTAGYNPWNLNGDATSNKKLVHWLGHAEYRRWLCKKFDGHFFGLHALGGEYNISEYEISLGFNNKTDPKFRYEGWAIGAGVSYGYQFILSPRWNIEATLGVGYAKLNYSRYECAKCGTKIDTKSKDYFGPTKAGISIIYLLK